MSITYFQYHRRTFSETVISFIILFFFFSFCFLLKAFEIASESLAPERWGLGSRELNTEMPINSPWSILRQTVLERPRADLIQGERPDL